MKQAKLISFLQEEMSIPFNALQIAIRSSEAAIDFLPLVLWQYGLISLKQLEQIFDWLEAA